MKTKEIELLCIQQAPEGPVWSYPVKAEAFVDPEAGAAGVTVRFPGSDVQHHYSMPLSDLLDLVRTSL